MFLSTNCGQKQKFIFDLVLTYFTMKKIEKVIKKAVKAASGKSDPDLSVIMYGLPEEKEDEKILHEMLQFTNDADKFSCAQDLPVIENNFESANTPLEGTVR